MSGMIRLTHVNKDGLTKAIAIRSEDVRSCDVDATGGTWIKSFDAGLRRISKVAENMETVLELIANAEK